MFVKPHRLLPLTGLFDHGGGDVDARDVSGNMSHRTGNEAGAAGDIQYRVLWADSCRLDDEPVGVFIVVVRHFRERHRLFCELLHNQPPLFFLSCIHNVFVAGSLTRALTVQTDQVSRN